MGCSRDSEIECAFQLSKRKDTEPIMKYVSQCTMRADLKDRWQCRSCSTELAYNAVRMRHHLQTKCRDHFAEIKVNGGTLSGFIVRKDPTHTTLQVPRISSETDRKSVV